MLIVPRCLKTILCGVVAAVASGGIVAAAAETDPLSVHADTTDAERFARAFERTGGRPDAATLQRDYLDGAGRGVAIFTPYRIVDAANLARAVSQDPERYAYAIRTCLPLIPSLDAELRAVYLAYRGLLPGRRLPDNHVVFGAGNSGGTAEPDAQVIGLEVMCGPGTTPAQFATAMRSIYAHETAHSLQPAPRDAATRDKLMYLAITEGAPDFLASVVTGRSPSPERDAFGRARESELWAQFQRDRGLLMGKSWEEIDAQADLRAALRRWFWNAGAAPPGMPAEMGYWIGMQIAAAKVTKTVDKISAIEELLQRSDPADLALQSGYQGRGPPVTPAEPR